MGQRARTSSSFRNSTHKEWKIYTFSPPIWRQCIIRYLESRYRQSYRLLKFWGNLAWWHHRVVTASWIEAPTLNPGSKCSAVWAEHQASASERLLRASASFTGSPVSDPCTLLSSPPEINALSLTISYPFQKWYCGISQNTLQKYTHAKCWPTQIEPVWWSFSLSIMKRCTELCHTLPRESSGLLWNLVLEFKPEKLLRENKAASVLAILYPECIVFHQMVRYFYCVHISNPELQRTKAQKTKVWGKIECKE